MRKLASLLLAVALAAPFGGAGALSSAGSAACLAAPSAAVQTHGGAVGHGVRGGGGSPGRVFLPAASPGLLSGEATGNSGPSPRLSGGTPPDEGASTVPQPGVGSGAPPRGRATPTGAFFQAFAAHPSTAPPLHA